MVTSNPRHTGRSNLTDPQKQEGQKFNHENNLPSSLSPQWLCCNSCTWVYDVRLQIADTSEPKGAQQAKQGIYLSGHKSTTTHSVEQNGHNIYVIIQTICPFGYHLDGLVTTHALGHIMLSYSYINFHPLKYILEHA